MVDISKTILAIIQTKSFLNVVVNYKNIGVQILSNIPNRNNIYQIGCATKRLVYKKLHIPIF